MVGENLQSINLNWWTPNITIKLLYFYFTRYVKVVTEVEIGGDYLEIRPSRKN